MIVHVSYNHRPMIVHVSYNHRPMLVQHVSYNHRPMIVQYVSYNHRQDRDPVHRRRIVKEYFLGTFHRGIIEVGNDSGRPHGNPYLTPKRFIFVVSSKSQGLHKIVYRFGYLVLQHMDWLTANPV